MLSAREQFFNSDGGTPGIGLGIEIGESGTAKPGRGVYNSTTVPMTSASSWRNGHTNTTSTTTPTGAAPIAAAAAKQPPLEPVVEVEEDFNIDTNALSNLPPREPVDIEFKELSLTVKLGFKRGECQHLRSSALTTISQSIKVQTRPDKIAKIEKKRRSILWIHTK